MIKRVMRVLCAALSALRRGALSILRLIFGRQGDAGPTTPADDAAALANTSPSLEEVKEEPPLLDATNESSGSSAE